MMRLRDWDWLGERSRPHFGQLTLWLLLLCAQPLAIYFVTHWGLHVRGPRTGPATILSFLPDSVLLSPLPIQVCASLFVLGSFLWLAQLAIPWSGWLTSLAFTAVVALYVENATQVTHVAHVTNVLLLLHALWYHFYRREIRAALAAGCFWSTPLYPRWVHALAVFYLGLFYGLSGLMKLLTSGPGWANGVSLQLWTNLWGEPGSLWTGLIREHRWVAVAMQSATLLGESSGLLAIFLPRLRPFIGLMLIGFHVGAICVFKWGFHANMVMLALFFLPCDRWVAALVARLERKAPEPRVIRYPAGWWGQLRKAVRARLDVLERCRPGP
jgi:hypothetical protein